MGGESASGDEGWFPATFWQEVPSGSRPHAQSGSPEYVPREDECQGNSVEEVWDNLVQHSQDSMSDCFRYGRELEETVFQLCKE